jgi:hypothetical protein
LKKIVLSPAIIFISWSAFSGCKQLEEFIIEDGEEPLTCWLTENLPGLKTFYLGRNLDYDGDEERHLNPANLTIGPKVTSLLNIFGDDLKEITSYIKDPTSVPEYFSSKVKANAVLKVPAGSYNLYCNTNGWKDFFFIEKISGGNVVIDSNTFPDETFRNWVLAQDYGADGILTDKEIVAIKTIAINKTSATNLKGIECFTALIRLWCEKNQLTSLDVSKNTALKELVCDNNQLTSLDLSKNTALTTLWCEKNQLTSLDLSKNTELTSLSFGWNYLTSIDLSKNTALTTLWCEKNQLTSLNLSKNMALKRIWCEKNQLTSLNLSKNTALNELVCRDNQLTSLDLSKNTELTSLNCQNNQLTSLDVSKNTALQDINCSINYLTSLDVSKNTALMALYCYRNIIKGVVMDALIADLPECEGSFYPIMINNDKEQNVVTKTQVATAKAKGWTTWCCTTGYEWSIYEGSGEQPSGTNSVYREASTNDRYYNLNGQRVEKPTKKGVYIVNGKKAVYNNQ